MELSCQSTSISKRGLLSSDGQRRNWILRCSRLQGTYKGRNVVYRILLDDNLLKTFLTKSNEVMSWKCRELVPILGLVASPQASLVSEYIPLGSLDMYLK